MPLSTISWRDAIRLTYLEKMDIVSYYDNWFVSSPSIRMQVPAIVATTEYFDFSKPIKFSKRNLFMRDMYMCQYCGNTFAESELTIDHVVPRADGGKTSWTNCVASCSPCNTKKGHARMAPLNEPFKPSYYAMVQRASSKPLFIKDKSWVNFLEPFNSNLILN